MDIDRYVHIRVYIYMHIYIYIYTYTYTYTCTYTYIIYSIYFIGNLSWHIFARTKVCRSHCLDTVLMHSPLLAQGCLHCSCNDFLSLWVLRGMHWCIVCRARHVWKEIKTRNENMSQHVTATAVLASCFFRQFLQILWLPGVKSEPVSTVVTLIDAA